MQFTHEHEELRRTLKRFIDDEINPHVDEWEEAMSFPAHEVFKKLGDRGLPNLFIPGPRDFFLVAELPVLGSGKLDLKRCKQMAVDVAGTS